MNDKRWVLILGFGLSAIALAIAFNLSASAFTAKKVTSIPEERQKNGGDGRVLAIQAGSPQAPLPRANRRELIESESSDEDAEVRPDEFKPLSAIATIRVIDEESRVPIEGATIRIGVSNSFSDSSKQEFFQNESDESGTSTVRVPLGNLSVCAFTADGRYGRTKASLRLESGIFIEVELSGLTAIAGIVLDKSSGHPIASARFSNHVTIGMGGNDVISKEDGTFEFGHWGVSKAAVLTVMAEGYGAAHLSLLVDKEKRWTLFGDESEFRMEDTTPYLEVYLEPEQWISGRVVCPDGAAVANASVRAVGAVTSSFFILVDDVAETRSIEDGFFELRGLRIDVPHLIICESPDLGIALSWATPGVLNLDLGSIALSPPASVEGFANDANGDPLAGSQIRVEIVSPLPPGANGQNRSESSVNRFKTLGKVKRDGSFLISGLIPGRAELIFEVGGEEVLRKAVRLLEGQPVRLGRIVIDIDCVLIDGILVGANESRLANRSLALVEGNSLWARAVTDHLGEFSLALQQDDHPKGLELVLFNDSGEIADRWMSRSGVFPSMLRTRQ